MVAQKITELSTTSWTVSENAYIHEAVDGQRHTAKSQQHRQSPWTTVETSHMCVQHPAQQTTSYTVQWWKRLEACITAEDGNFNNSCNLLAWNSHCYTTQQLSVFKTIYFLGE